MIKISINKYLKHYEYIPSEEKHLLGGFSIGEKYSEQEQNFEYDYFMLQLRVVRFSGFLFFLSFEKKILILLSSLSQKRRFKGKVPLFILRIDYFHEDFRIL